MGLTKKEKQWLIQRCCGYLESAKEGTETITLKNYKSYSYNEFSGEYGITKGEYNLIVSCLNKLKNKMPRTVNEKRMGELAESIQKSPYLNPKTPPEDFMKKLQKLINEVRELTSIILQEG